MPEINSEVGDQWAATRPVSPPAHEWWCSTSHNGRCALPDAPEPFDFVNGREAWTAGYEAALDAARAQDETGLAALPDSGERSGLDAQPNPREALLLAARNLHYVSRHAGLYGDCGIPVCHALSAVLATPAEERLPPIDRAVYDHRGARINALENALAWALRNSGGECPVDDPAGYANALETLIRRPAALTTADTGAPEVPA